VTCCDKLTGTLCACVPSNQTALLCR
jgi:hypothetical protein